MKTKTVLHDGYEAPECKVFNINVEGQLMNVSNGVNYSDNQGGAGGNDSYDDGEGF